MGVPASLCFTALPMRFEATWATRSTQMSQLEGKLTDAQQAEQALQQQYADLARNRDDWTLAEVGQMLSAASQQLQLTSNMRSWRCSHCKAPIRDSRPLDGAQVMAVRKAIAQDIHKTEVCAVD